MLTQASLPRILVYQNKNCGLLVEYLIHSGFNVINTSEEDVLKKLREQGYDLCILDYFKADELDGLKLLHFMHRLDKKIPVIFVSDLFDYAHIIEAFKSGVDDYVVRPYNIEELICRIKAVLKRCGIKVRRVELAYNIGNYTFNTETNILKLEDAEKRLTIKESRLLALLCAYKNELLSKELLLRDIWKDDNYYNKRSLDVHICHLRNYLSQDGRIKINTIKRMGYSLTIDDESK